jgi:hypothetical protein
LELRPTTLGGKANTPLSPALLISHDISACLYQGSGTQIRQSCHPSREPKRRADRVRSSSARHQGLRRIHRIAGTVCVRARLRS